MATLRLGTSPADVERAGEILRAGGRVAIPTETVYGLAANALDAAAVESIFAAKERPHWDPLIVHLADLSMLPLIAAPLSPVAKRLADAFWPGPLTMLLPRKRDLPTAVTAGRELVGVRIPAHPVAIAILKAARVPLAAPSANRFGRISPTSAQHVLADLEGRIEAVVDAGATVIGVESTVLDPNTNPILIYRHGGISAAEIHAVSGRQVQTYLPPNREAAPSALPSPGVGIRHYAPQATLLLVQDEMSLNQSLKQISAKKTGVMLPGGWKLHSQARAVFKWGAWDDPSELARNLYAGLRTLDQAGVGWILCPMPIDEKKSDLRAAVRDRLLKAAMPKG